MTINAQVIDTSKIFQTNLETVNAVSITPNSVSPVLKTKVVITLDPAFPATLDRADFTVNATDTSNVNYKRYLNVLSVDDTAKTLTCMFGGAESGTFQMNIRHKSLGLINTKNLILDVSASVSSISPKTGSIYGGTLVTITGDNFGTVKTDNPV
jgi:hypothetical protein